MAQCVTVLSFYKTTPQTSRINECENKNLCFQIKSEWHLINKAHFKINITKAIMAKQCCSVDQTMFFKRKINWRTSIHGRKAYRPTSFMSEFQTWSFWIILIFVFFGLSCPKWPCWTALISKESFVEIHSDICWTLKNILWSIKYLLTLSWP